jgi:hypothetical protein
MDFTNFKNFDPTQFDVTKMVDITAALEQIEKNTKSAVDLIPDAKSREMASAISEASIKFARAQAEATKAYLEAVKKVIKA